MATPWQQVASRCSGVSVFMSPAWVGAWWASFAEQLRPEVLLWRDPAGEPGAIALLSVREERIGPLRLRSAYLNATGEGAVATEHNTILCVPGMEKTVRRDLARRLREQRVDRLRLEGFRAGDAVALFGIWGQRGPVTGFYSEDRYVPLGTLRRAHTPFLASVSRNTREQINRSLRRYAQLYGERPRAQRARDATEAAQWFAELQALHAVRWRARGGEGAFADPAVQRMHAGIVAAGTSGALAAGGVTIDIVRVSAGQQPIGYLYNLIKDGVVAFYQSGLRYETDPKLKPGLVTHSLAIQLYLEAGLDEYDFLAGEALPVQYKASLASGTRRLAWLNLYPPTLKFRALNAARRLWRTLRRRRP